MKYSHQGLCVLISSILVFSSTSISLASDREKEKRWAEQVSDALVDGEPVYLNDGDADFLAIYTRAEAPGDTGIIVLHGSGVHPDWEQVIHPLRVGLAEAGWNTLSLQMPVLANDASHADYMPLMKDVPARIDAGIRYLHKEGTKKVVLVAHSLGAYMASYYLAHKTSYMEAQTETPIIAYVGIGMGGGNAKYLSTIKLPILDLYGSLDSPGVLKSVSQRARAAKHNKFYKQQRIKAANHFFEGKNIELLEAVKRNLKNVF